jgi:hypothetical protein
MHLQRAISNFAILIVGSLASSVAFLSTRLNEVVFYGLVGACVVLMAVVISTAKTRMGRHFPALLGKPIVPRWNISLKSATQFPIAAYRAINKTTKSPVPPQTLLPAQPQRANAA